MNFVIEEIREELNFENSLNSSSHSSGRLKKLMDEDFDETLSEEDI